MRQSDQRGIHRQSSDRRVGRLSWGIQAPMGQNAHARFNQGRNQNSSYWNV
jgi:hypothetical protein